MSIVQLHMYHDIINNDHQTFKPEIETKIRSAVFIQNAKVLFLAQN